MDITRADAHEPGVGPASSFTGEVGFEARFVAPEPARTNVAAVRFAPGARTAWHTHPYGQLLIITDGQGWVQTDGGAKQTVEAGDMVWFSAGEKHWHGATKDTGMSHLAIQEMLDGNPTTWLEHVADADYLG